MSWFILRIFKTCIQNDPEGSGELERGKQNEGFLEPLTAGWLVCFIMFE